MISDWVKLNSCFLILHLISPLSYLNQLWCQGKFTRPWADPRSGLLQKLDTAIWPPPYQWLRTLCEYKSLLLASENTADSFVALQKLETNICVFCSIFTVNRSRWTFDIGPLRERAEKVCAFHIWLRFKLIRRAAAKINTTDSWNQHVRREIISNVLDETNQESTEQKTNRNVPPLLALVSFFR